MKRSVRPVFLNEEISAVKDHWRKAKRELLSRDVRVRRGHYAGTGGTVIQVKLTNDAEVRAVVKLDFKPGNYAHAPKLVLGLDEFDLEVSR